jgi:predicted class III extradiol MEMO1 family dioxygenase
MGNINLLIWKGITLRSESKIMGMTMLEEAESVKTGISFPDSDFMPPKDVVISKNDISSFGNNTAMDDADMEKINQLQDMSYKDFKKMIQQKEPDISEKEIKQAYEMIKK